jgi:hypothetical protein
LEVFTAYVFVTRLLYPLGMSPLAAVKLFREKADAYLDMTGRVSDEGQRRILHKLFEEHEANAEFLERMIHSHERFEAFRIAGRMN